MPHRVLRYATVYTFIVANLNFFVPTTAPLPRRNNTVDPAYVAPPPGRHDLYPTVDPGGYNQHQNTPAGPTIGQTAAAGQQQRVGSVHQRVHQTSNVSAMQQMTQTTNSIRNRTSKDSPFAAFNNPPQQQRPGQQYTAVTHSGLTQLPLANVPNPMNPLQQQSHLANVPNPMNPLQQQSHLANVPNPVNPYMQQQQRQQLAQASLQRPIDLLSMPEPIVDLLSDPPIPVQQYGSSSRVSSSLSSVELSSLLDQTSIQPNLKGTMEVFYTEIEQTEEEEQEDSNGEKPQMLWEIYRQRDNSGKFIKFRHVNKRTGLSEYSCVAPMPPGKAAHGMLKLSFNNNPDVQFLFDSTGYMIGRDDQFNVDDVSGKPTEEAIKSRRYKQISFQAWVNNAIDSLLKDKKAIVPPVQPSDTSMPTVYPTLSLLQWVKLPLPVHPEFIMPALQKNFGYTNVDIKHKQFLSFGPGMSTQTDELHEIMEQLDDGGNWFKIEVKQRKTDPGSSSKVQYSSATFLRDMNGQLPQITTPMLLFFNDRPAYFDRVGMPITEEMQKALDLIRTAFLTLKAPLQLPGGSMPTVYPAISVLQWVKLPLPVHPEFIMPDTAKICGYNNVDIKQKQFGISTQTDGLNKIMEQLDDGGNWFKIEVHQRIQEPPPSLKVRYSSATFVRDKNGQPPTSTKPMLLFFNDRPAYFDKTGMSISRFAVEKLQLWDAEEKKKAGDPFWKLFRNRSSLEDENNEAAAQEKPPIEYQSPFAMNSEEAAAAAKEADARAAAKEAAAKVAATAKEAAAQRRHQPVSYVSNPNGVLQNGQNFVSQPDGQQLPRRQRMRPMQSQMPSSQQGQQQLQMPSQMMQPNVPLNYYYRNHQQLTQWPRARIRSHQSPLKQPNVVVFSQDFNKRKGK